METKRAAINGLAVVGFISLVILAVILAGNVARFMPTIVNGAATGLANVVVGVTSIFVPEEGDVIVVTDDNTDTATSTDNTTFPVVLPNEQDDEEETPGSNPVTNPNPGGETTDIIEQPGPISDPNGTPDLVPTILATGVLVNGFQAENFVATSTLKKSDRIAVKFAITNSGTKETGTNWRFNVVMPTENTYTFNGTEAHVQNLLPGERIEYVIGFDRSRVGEDLLISVAVDPANTTPESNEENNGAFAKITVTN